MVTLYTNMAQRAALHIMAELYMLCRWLRNATTATTITHSMMYWHSTDSKPLLSSTTHRSAKLCQVLCWIAVLHVPINMFLSACRQRSALSCLALVYLLHAGPVLPIICITSKGPRTCIRLILCVSADHWTDCITRQWSQHGALTAALLQLDQ